jgi:hypothetical protein
MGKEEKPLKQTTLDNLPNQPSKEKSTAINAPKQNKQIIITQIETKTLEEDLHLKIVFQLKPSQAAFSKVKTNLWFDKQLINAVNIKILGGPLSTDEMECDQVLDMKGITPGPHSIAAEMFEPWDSEEKLSQVKKEITINYIPKKRANRLVKVPSIKSVAGKDLAVESSIERNIIKDIENTVKKDHLNKRDEW